jgi:glycosyltransferase involved in cell wall biosynthesis
LTDALSNQDTIEVKLLAQGLVGKAVVALSPGSQVARSIAKSSNKIALSLGLPLNRQLQSCLNLHKPDIIHGHGVWHPVSYWCGQATKKYRIPLVIHPRGMLEPWALNHRKLKKRIALWLYQHRDLQRAKVLFATAEQEAQNLRHFGLRQPIAITPNGIPFPALESQVSPRQSSRHRTALFLSRIHPKKGLINLIQAWHQISPPGWQLIIAGPNENNHLAQVKAQIKQHQLEQVIKILDSVEGEAKANLYRQADLFILPTFSENFGVVVAEALSYGVPVITTTGTPWQDLQTHHCGWWVEPTVATIADALQEATILHPQELRTMGERGRAYVKCYDWDSIAQDTIAVYQWILNQGPKPDCVILD